MHVLGIQTQQFLAQSVEQNIVSNAGQTIHGCGAAASQTGAFAWVAKISSKVVQINARSASVQSSAVDARRLAGIAGLVNLIVPSGTLSNAHGGRSVVYKNEVGRCAGLADRSGCGTAETVAGAGLAYPGGGNNVAVGGRTGGVATVVEEVGGVVAGQTVGGESARAGQTVRVAGKTLLLVGELEIPAETETRSGVEVAVASSVA